MIINIHKYFSNPAPIDKQHQKLTLRKRVAMVTGVSESAVGVAVSDWNQCNNGKFSSHKILGRPKSQPDENITTLLCTNIIDANMTAQQLATPILQAFLSEHGYEISKWRLLRILHHLGYYYGRGERRNILHESPNNVAFCCQYLRYQFANLESNNDIPHAQRFFSMNHIVTYIILVQILGFLIVVLFYHKGMVHC